jgi:hypothetical protein
MRALRIEEMEIVSGGELLSQGDVIAITGALGAGVGMGLGQWAGLTAAQQVTLAGYVGTSATALSASFAAGYTLGQVINANTNIQDVIAEIIDYASSQDGDE